MPEVTSEQISARLKQFDVAVKAVLAEGGVVVAGTVMRKTNWPAKEGKSASYSVQLGYFGGSCFVNVSERLWQSIGVGSYQLFVVTQRASDSSIYNTAVEP